LTEVWQYFIIAICGISSVVERHPSKLNVSGSNPLFRFPFGDSIPWRNPKL
jgi:hypothetical protein